MSKKREIRIRKCVATGKRVQQAELIRVACVDGHVVIDLAGMCPGRGAYITPDVNVIEKAKKKNPFARALRMKVNEKIYDELLEIVGEGHE